MKPNLTKAIIRSLIYYWKDAVYQVLIVALLSAIITGSLFTGESVRSSLRKTASEKLGGTGIVISTGLRFFDASLSERIAIETGERTASILETDGYCQNFSTGVTALNTKIYGIGNGFFSFHGIDSLFIEPGTVAINASLSRQLELEKGDEIIIRFTNIDPIPANAPFAPSKNDNSSKVMRVGKILDSSQSGNFSLGISQITPVNIFMNLSDINSEQGKSVKVNRLLIQNKTGLPASSYIKILSKSLTPADLGLNLRKSEKTGEPEIVSDRIFIDSTIVKEIIKVIPSAAPLITYLANSIDLRKNSTPYSFISALPPALYPGIGNNETVINKWLAQDLNANTGDSIRLTWYDPGFGRLLVEKSKTFIICKITNNEERYSDPSLMPDFPGISGSTTCSEWDAGIPILMNKIREKDEDYWNKYKGTPKAFISYNTGKEIWGNNFGPATAIRFNSSMELAKISEQLTGSFDPLQTGFTITNIRDGAKKAATEGVDFGTLFLSLSFFIILSCIVLLSLAVTVFFDSRKSQIRTYFALGFRNSKIRNLLFLETLFISVIGAFAGILIGYYFNRLIIIALNSVWSGAVQTDTLSPGFSFLPLLSGFLTTILITTILLQVKMRKFLNRLTKSRTAITLFHSQTQNLVFLLLFFIVALILLFIPLSSGSIATLLSFSGGAMLFASMILLLRQYYIGNTHQKKNLKNNYSRRYYLFHPSHAVTPVIFIAAGIFAIIITGANRQRLSDRMLLPSGGTGGYLLWAESAVPVKENLNTKEGKKEFGLDETDLKDIKFIQAKRQAGDDASCLNINHVTTPSILGIDPEDFIRRGSFSFASRLQLSAQINPWSLLNENPDKNTIYGIADQTVLEWGLKIKTGDTLKYSTESGQPLDIIICGGLKSSVFQGYLIIGERNFEKYFPSVAGSSVFLIDGKQELSKLYIDAINQRLSGYGISVESAGEKLVSFFRVTNTYLDVFLVLGAFGLILGAAGLGFILIRNFNERKREFAIMMATGYSPDKIRKLLLKDQIIILIWGILTGTISALSSTWPSIKSGAEMPWSLIIIMILAIFAIGLIALFFSVRQVRSKTLILQLRKE